MIKASWSPGMVFSSTNRWESGSNFLWDVGPWFPKRVERRAFPPSPSKLHIKVGSSFQAVFNKAAKHNRVTGKNVLATQLLSRYSYRSSRRSAGTVVLLVGVCVLCLSFAGSKEACSLPACPSPEIVERLRSSRAYCSVCASGMHA